MATSYGWIAPLAISQNSFKKKKKYRIANLCSVTGCSIGGHLRMPKTLISGTGFPFLVRVSVVSDTFERFPPERPPQGRGKQETMGSADILMLEAGPDPEAKGRWRNEEMDDAFDALPYIDNDYSDPKVKAEVDKLIAEEMRLGPKRPADFLSQLPPAPTFDLEVCALPFTTLSNARNASLEF